MRKQFHRVIWLTLVLALALGGLGALAEAEGWTCPVCGSDNAGNFCGKCGQKRPDATAEPTSEPTPEPTPQPTASWDVPSVRDYVTERLVLGEWGVKDAREGNYNNGNTEYKFYGYDYHGSDTQADWIKPYIEAVTRDGPFIQVDYRYEDLLSVGTEFESYYFRYTGDKSLSEICTDFTCRDEVAKYDLEIAVRHYHSREQVYIGINMPGELTYAG